MHVHRMHVAARIDPATPSVLRRRMGYCRRSVYGHDFPFIVGHRTIPGDGGAVAPVFQLQIRDLGRTVPGASTMNAPCNWLSCLYGLPPMVSPPAVAQ